MSSVDLHHYLSPHLGAFGALGGALPPTLMPGAGLGGGLRPGGQNLIQVF